MTRISLAALALVSVAVLLFAADAGMAQRQQQRPGSVVIGTNNPSPPAQRQRQQVAASRPQAPRRRPQTAGRSGAARAQQPRFRQAAAAAAASTGGRSSSGLSRVNRQTQGAQQQVRPLQQQARPLQQQQQAVVAGQVNQPRCDAIICPAILAPVCGSDGRTYTSACHMQQDNCRNAGRPGFTQVFVLAPGECESVSSEDLAFFVG